MPDPELNFEQAYEDYRRLGYSDRWINQRLKSIEVRKELTDEWDRAGIERGQQYASLTDIITKREATIPVFINHFISITCTLNGRKVIT